jgi:lipopolysaccharide heptosyltransferase II
VRVSRPNRRYQIALFIDRWVGPPLCAALLAVRVLRGRRAPLPPPERVSRILVLKLWGMGSIVLATPLLRRLRERHPGARIDFVTLRENAAVLALIPEVDRAVTLDLSRGIARFLAGTLAALWRIRRERYDLLFDLEFFTRFSALFSHLAAPARSHGFSAKGKWRGRLHDVEVPFNGYHHVALNFLTLLRAEPMEPVDADELAGPDALPRLCAPESAWRACREKLSADPAWRDDAPLVVVNPNAGDMALERRWPAESSAELLRHLCARSRANVVAIGAPAERAYVESVLRASGAAARVVNAAGRIDIAELVALLGQAAVVVSNDSGPLHLAAAAGASTAALFGPETPILYGPLRSRPGQRHAVHYLELACSPCMFVHDNKVLSCWFAQARCMTGIRPAQVLASVDALLGEATGRGAAELRVIDS